MGLIKFLQKAVSPGGHDCAGEVSCFQSAKTTGTGSQQAIAHGLGKVPTKVRVSLVGSPPVTYVGCTITEGAHDATNVYVTCTSNWAYQVEAYG